MPYENILPQIVSEIFMKTIILLYKKKVDLSAVYLAGVSLIAVCLTTVFGAALQLTTGYIVAVYLTIVNYTALDCYVHDFSVHFCSLLNVYT